MSVAEKIFVDLNEDIVFTIESIKSAESKNVIVIVPKSANITSSLISLKLLSRQLLKTDKLITVVTDDSIGERLSKRAGLQVVENVSQIDNSVWEGAFELKEEAISNLERVKRDLLNKRTEQKNIPQVNDYKIVDDEEELELDKEEVKKDVEDEEVVSRPKKSRIPSRVISLGGIKFLAAGDINQNEELLAELIKKEEKIEDIISDRDDSSADDSDREDDPPQESEMDEFSEEENEDSDEEFIDEEELNPRKKPLIGKDLSRAVSKPRVSRSELQQGFGKSAGAGIGFLQSFTKNISAFFAQDPKRKFFALAIIPIFLVIFFVFGSRSKAEITVSVKQDSVAISETVTAQTTATAIDPQTFIIPATLRTSEEDSSESATATGTGTKGEKAKGQITIYNFTSGQISIPAGTVVTIQSSSLNYVTNANIAVPAAEQGVPGTADNVAITASEHGTNYNSDADKWFKVGAFPYSETGVKAKTFYPITEGTSQMTTVVSENDLSSIKDVLKKRVESTSKTKLASLAGADEIMLENTTQVEVLEESSTKNVGEEATKFDVSIKAKISAFYIKKADVEELVKKIAQQKQNIEGESNINIPQFPKITDIVLENGTAKFKLTSDASAKAAVDKDTIRKEIEGKSLSEADKYLKDQPDVTSYNINYSPWYMPGFLKKIPAGENLTIRVSAK